MDEDELDQYLEQIDALEAQDRETIPDPLDVTLIEPLRDEDGHVVPGCYRTLPAPTI